MFSHGGFQQARGATLTGKNRFYMEGSVEFLDNPGEWHYDPTDHSLLLLPPSEMVAASLLGKRSSSDFAPSVVLTQTDMLIDIAGSSSDAGNRVENIVISNLTFAHTSAQFFRPHEETSGGDYAIRRSGVITAENVTGLRIVGNEFRHIGGNGVFLSNSIRDANVTANIFQFLGTSGVSVVGKTGMALMDGRDGEVCGELFNLLFCILCLSIAVVASLFGICITLRITGELDNACMSVCVYSPARR